MNGGSEAATSTFDREHISSHTHVSHYTMLYSPNVVYFAIIKVVLSFLLFIYYYQFIIQFKDCFHKQIK